MDHRTSDVKPPAGEGAGVEADVALFRKAFARLCEAVGIVHRGRPDVIEELCLCLFAGGHALLEGVPGLGKTTLVRGLAAALELSFARIQFTPDLMPGDILGARILEEGADGRRRFAFQRGPIFAQVVLADEINRATPRTQSALLEAMAERQVTSFGESRALEEPFTVVATMNPIEMEGTYPLPEAQLDRFLLKILLDSPKLAELVDVLSATSGEHAPGVTPVLGADDVRRLRSLVQRVPASSEMIELAARTVLATHPVAGDAPDVVVRSVRHGASPRGGQAMLAAAKARALSRGRLHVAQEDLQAVCVPALRHRLILSYEGEAAGVRSDDLVHAAWSLALERG